MTYTCEYHNQIVEGEDNACEQCMAERDQLPAIETMTAQQRAAEFEMWINREQLTVKWSVFKSRLEALLGRGIWTHELARDNCANLVKEAWGLKSAPQFVDELIDKLPEHLRATAIPFNPDGDDPTASLS